MTDRASNCSKICDAPSLGRSAQSHIALRPRRLTHTGSVLAHGIWVSIRDNLRPAQRLVWEFWRSDAEVYRLEAALIIRYACPVRIDCGRCRATPLIQYGSMLSTVPLEPAEQTSLPQIQNGLLEAVGGQLCVHSLSRALRVDPSDWLLLDLTVEQALPVRRPPPPPLPAVPDPPKTTRGALDDVIDGAPAEQKSVQAALARNAGRAAERFRFGTAFQALMHRLRSLVEHFRTPKGSARHVRASRPPAPGTALARAPTPAFWQRWFQRWAPKFRSWIWRSRLGSWLGRQHAAYLQRMLDMFARGEFEEALRYAIPTSKLPGSESAPALLPAGPRESIRLGELRQSAHSLSLDGELFQHLRTTYRAAFRELERQGKILQAAFVLSELLQEDAEAVDFLERHCKLVHAATLAEARRLAPGLVVRQWFLAGDRQRALIIARRDGAFEDAIARLKSCPEEQRALRLLWADQLAEAGDYCGAVLVLDQSHQTEALRRQWLERAIRVGGVAGARALALKTHLFPDAFEETRTSACELLDDETPELAPSRVEFAHSLARYPGQRTAALIRGAARALIRDRFLGLNQEPRGSLKSLAQTSEDGALHTDLPDFPTRDVPELQTVTEAIHLVIEEGDTGPGHLTDASVVQGNRLLVAKGEAGCFLLTRKGRLIHHFDVPARHLVISTLGDRALALAPRDGITVVSRIDLLARRCQRWCELELSAWTKRFDGATWYVALNQRAHALDAAAPGTAFLWRSANTDSSITQIAWRPKRLAFVTEANECWTHDLQPHRLRQRSSFDGTPILSPRGIAAELKPMPFENTELLSLVSPDRTQVAGLGGSDVVGAAVYDVANGWFALGVHVPIEVPSSVDIKLVHKRTLHTAFQIRLENSRVAQARLETPHLVVCDERGRLVVVNLDTGTLVMNLRI